jgi:hypothetical protein
MLIALTKFIGLAPRISPHLLPENAATVAVSCKLGSGSLEPFDGILDTGTNVDGATVSLYRKKSTGAWVDFVDDTDVVRSPVRNDKWDRVYWTDDDPNNEPQMGINETFTTSYDLGVPPPSTSPTATAAGTATSTDPLLAETRAYVVTYVTAYDEEGPPCEVDSGDFVVVYPGEYVSLSNLPTGGYLDRSGNPQTGGNFNITKKNIYRTNTGTESTDFQLVGTVSLATTDWDDQVASSDLGVVLPSVGWDQPPADMHGLCSHPAGFLVGFSGREVCLSEQFLPHAWPVANKYPIDTDVVDVAVFGTSILVLTNRLPYILSGNDPGAMYLEKPESGWACLNKRGVVDFGDVIVYPSAEGLVAVGVGTPPTIITSDILDEDDWIVYRPDTMEGYRWDQRYFAVTPNAPVEEGFIFDIKTKDFTLFSSLYFDAGYYDETEGELYLAAPSGLTELYKWDADAANPKTLTWRSKEFIAPRPASFAAGQVFANDYDDVTMKVYAYNDSTDVWSLIHTQTVTSEAIFRLPSNTLSRRWQIELEGSSVIDSAYMATSVKELRQV